MKGFLRGFTIIEVLIFLGITGLLFIGVTAGVQNSVTQQRKNDSVQGFLDFVRNVYSEVTNVQNTAGGRSDQAIYGKLIVFGEEYNLAGDKIEDENQVFVYTMIGNANNDVSGSGVIELLKNLKASIVKTTEDAGKKVNSFAGITESYTLRWGAELEPKCEDMECDYSDFTGMILIVRHPKSGNVYTLYSPKRMGTDRNGNGEIDGINAEIKNSNTNGITLEPFDDEIWDSFEVEEIDICINTSGQDKPNTRSDLRIEKGASNASGVQIVAEDSEDNRCRL